MNVPVTVRQPGPACDMVLASALEQVDRGFFIEIGQERPVPDRLQLLVDRGWSGVRVPVRNRSSKAEGSVAIGTWLVGPRGRNRAHDSLSSDESLVLDPNAASMLDALADAGHLPIETHLLHCAASDCAVPSLSTFDRVKPWIVSINHHASGSGSDIIEWDRLLSSQRYDLCFDDGASLVYVAADHSDLAVEVRAVQAGLDAATAETTAGSKRLADVLLNGDVVFGGKLRPAIRQLASDNEQLRRERDHLLRRIDGLRKDRDYYRVAHARLKLSLSWWITAPIRKLWRAWKHVKSTATSLQPHSRFVLLPPLAIGQTSLAGRSVVRPSHLPESALWSLDRLRGQSE